MSQAKAEHRIPYPIDEELIRQAHSIGDGRFVHDVNQKICNYECIVKAWNQSFEHAYWNQCVNAERSLRGVIAEARLGVTRRAPWADPEKKENA